MSQPSPLAPREQALPRVYRTTEDRWVGGVCGGLARHFHSATWVFRLAFVAATLVGGVGLLAYALMWAFLPLAAHDPGGDPRIAARSWDVTGMLGLLSLVLGLVLAASALGIPIRTSVWVPLLLLCAGVAVLWRQSDDAQRQYLLSQAQAGVRGAGLISDRTFWLRSLLGAGLVCAGAVAAIGPRVDLWTGLRALAAAGAVVAGLALIALPWLAGWVKSSQARRYAQIRAEERAAMAARVHDSVLQTLTLIQRRAHDQSEVIRLARAEERALRAWLYSPSAPTGTLRPALEQVVADAETDYEARIELVTVGDATVDDRIDAVVGATREAVVNAAKHSGAPITVYAEVSKNELEVNVLDRGCGFDPESVGDDRHGVRESIIARTAAVGGQATVRSGTGVGTEVRLRLPLGGQDD